MDSMQPYLTMPARASMAGSGGFSYYDHVGHDLSVEQLRATHHAVIFASGAESDRRLNVNR